MSGSEVVCSGWLRKSPPEKKLRRYAWKKRWFVLRSGRLSGEPDVLEYYKSDSARRPLRVIDLNLCEQVDAGLSFERRGFDNAFIFDIKTLDRTFYLVADSEGEMNKWVQCICNVCGFNPHENDHVKACEVTGQVRTDSVSRARSGSQPLVSLSTQSVVTSPPPPYQVAPLRMRPSICQEDGADVQEYLLLSECLTTVPSHDSPCSVLGRMQTEEYYMLEDWKGKGTQVKNQVSTSSESDLSPEVLKQIVSPPSEPQPAANDITPLLPHDPHNLTPEKDLSNNSYICPRSHSLDSSVEPTYDLPPVSECPSQSPRIFTFDQNRASEPMLTGSVSTVSQQSLQGEGNMPPPRPPKPSSVTIASSEDEKCAYSYPRSQSVGDEALYSLSPPAVTRRSNTISTLDNSPFRRESYDHPRTTVSNVGNSLESVGDGYSSYMRKKSLLCSSEGELDHTYMTMEPSPALSTTTSSSREGTACDSPAEGPYIPMGSPRSHFDFSPQGSQTLPCASPSAVTPRRASSTSLRWAMTPLVDPLPPPVDRNLKPDRKGGKPAPLVIRPVEEEGEEMDVPVHSPFTKSYRSQRVFSYKPRRDSIHSNSSSSSSEEAESISPPTKNSSINASPAQPVSTSNSPRPRHVMPHQVEYLDLDLPGSPGSTLQKPTAPSSNISDEKVDYVIVDKNKTLALQNTKEAWQDERQDKR
uniref:GRB2-associated-binding protein 1-like isoform X2 n=1 Tax=Myxine glutinosa TaxID=7769 RepID=UPI00358F38F4